MGEPLNSIRSDATATPEAPTPPSYHSSPPQQATPGVSAPRQPKYSAPRGSNANASARTGARHTSSAENRQAAKEVSRQADMAIAPKIRALTEASDRLLRELRRMDPGFYDYFQGWMSERMPFHWRERRRRRVSWRRRTVIAAVLVVGVILAALIGNVGITVMRQVSQVFASAAALGSSQPSTPGSVIIAPAANTGINSSPTPGPTVYAVGVWTSDSTPSGGSVTVYVRVSNKGAAVPKTRVYLQVSLGADGGGYRMGPYTTDAYGMATIHLNYGAGGGTPVFLTAYATISGQTYTGKYTFVGL
ncbi:MAG TPA: hypothetical protein VF808_17675 [Ktedonobacterales bacterium]